MPRCKWQTISRRNAILWTDTFESRILYNTCKAFSQQINKGNPFDMLAPVYSLIIINQSFSKQSIEWMHHYKLSHQSLGGRYIEGIEFILLALPNFIPENLQSRRITARWLRFLKEIKNRTTMISEELMEVPEIAEAIEALKESSYSQKELEQYEKYWDIVHTQTAFAQDALKKGKNEGKIEGKLEEKLTIGKSLKIRGFSNEEISEITGLNLEEEAAL